MFPTFISILDIQSWWEVPSIAHFCSLFRTAFSLLDFDIEDLEEALLTDGTEETSWLQELIVRLLSGCLPNNEISTFNYQMFLRRLFRQKCQEHDRYNPFNTDIDFQLLPLRTKVDILHALCDFRLDADDVIEQLKNLEADSLRVEPLGYDSNESAYWYFYGTRLYREDYKTKNNKKKCIWQVICFTEDDWFQLNKKLKKSTSKSERQLYHTLNENFLPELPRLFREKERLARKRLLENQPRRTSRRLKNINEKELEEKKKSIKLAIKENLETEEETEKPKRKELEIIRKEAYERRTKLKERSEENNQSVIKSKSRYEMAGVKIRQKKSSKNRHRKYSTNSTNNNGIDTTFTSKRSDKRFNKQTNDGNRIKLSSSTTVGRQTNNSLAAATGQIVIQPVSNPHKKKLKTSQVFRQTDEDLLIGMHKILDYVKNHEDSWPFADPVDEDYAPNYYSVIRKPMDLQKMEERLDSGYYKNFVKFRDDFQLIVDNCRLYNGAENEYTEMVDNLLKVFERATEKFLDEISSSDDEIAVEYPDSETDNIQINNVKRKKKDIVITTSKRKPTLAARTDKRNISLSEESLDNCSESLVSIELHNSNNRNNNETKKNDKDRKVVKVVANKKINYNNNKKEKVNNSSRINKRINSNSPSINKYESSPLPSSSDSIFDFYLKKSVNSVKEDDSTDELDIKNIGKQKHKQDKFEEKSTTLNFTHCDKKSKKEVCEKSNILQKPKDKHIKLRETIEKLKAKSEISSKINKNHEFNFELDILKENKKKIKVKKNDNNKKLKAKHTKKDLKFNNGDNICSTITDNKKSSKKQPITMSTKNSTIDALTIVTEQTLKDINKWLDDTPKYNNFSSASNSPVTYTTLNEFESINSKVEQKNQNKQHQLQDLRNKKLIKKEHNLLNKEIKRNRTSFIRDPNKFINKRREVQRTTDRLQPGKSKGNLITNIQLNKTNDELFLLGSLLKSKDLKNSLIVKTDDNAPKLSLGSVLNSFGKHKFNDDQKKTNESEKIKSNLTTKSSDNNQNSNNNNNNENEKDNLIDEYENIENENKHLISLSTIKSNTILNDENNSNSGVNNSNMMSGATPNLSAWFKAFGAPRISSAPKKIDNKSDLREISDKCEDTTTKISLTNNFINKKEDIKPSSLEMSPNSESPLIPVGQPVPRQRKISTGSSISERSSFSQDMDSPRVGIDERLGAYPAPYPSPLHRSPSSASPIMASPRPDVSPKSTTYSTFNGQMRVGFYQDTVSSTKSSPDKSCSPCRENHPQSSYTPQCPEHVYITSNTTQNINYSPYTNSPYYTTHATNNYSNNSTNIMPYNLDLSNNINSSSSSYYDTNKSLTDQYQAKSNPNNYTITNTPISKQNHSPNITNENYRDDQNKISEKFNQTSTVFPVKKRAYNNESDINCYEMENKIINNTIHNDYMNGNYRHLNSQQTISSSSTSTTSINMNKIQTRTENQENNKQYLNQNVTESKLLTVQSPIIDPYDKNHQNSNIPQIQENSITNNNSRHYQLISSSPYNTSNINSSFNNETNYSLSLPIARDLPAQDIERKMDISKYTNMGYTGHDANFTRNVQQQYNRSHNLNYPNTISNQSHSSICNSNEAIQSSQQTNNLQLRYTSNANNDNDNHHLQMGYKNMEMHVSNNNNTRPTDNRLLTQSIDRSPTSSLSSSVYKSDASVPRPAYNTHIDMDQPLSLRGNIANLSHIVDRYNNDERILSGLSSTASSQYYGDKSISGTHMFSKTITTSTTTGLSMFNQPNMSSVQAAYTPQNIQSPTSIYNRQLTELQSPSVLNNETKNANPVQTVQGQEKKTKKRKSTKNASSSNLTNDIHQSNNQGFQSYAGLKTTNSVMEPSAISLKTTSVVPGSAFNFGPTPTGLGISAGSLYGDKDAYPNYLDDFRSAPNYYMAAAAAAATHHRSTPDQATTEKQNRAVHQNPVTSQTSTNYPFIGAPQVRPPPGYPSLGGPFMPTTAQAQLMDSYQHYVLNQGLLGPPGPYTPGYHALSMRQPYDSMTRPSWL